jgi:hypothetical protein
VRFHSPGWSVVDWCHTPVHSMDRGRVALSLVVDAVKFVQCGGNVSRH